MHLDGNVSEKISANFADCKIKMTATSKKPS